MFTVLTGNVAKNSNIFEITDNVIDDNSIIEVYPSDESIIPVEVSVTGSTLVVTFDSKAANIIPIKIFVNNLVGEYVPPSHETIDDENVINTNSSVPRSNQKEINFSLTQGIDRLIENVGDVTSLETEADNLTDAVNEINEKLPDGEYNTFLSHTSNGNIWKILNAFTLDYDDNSTLFSVMGDIDELTTTSKNLVGAINEVKGISGGINYATTESVIGTYLGKPLYSRIFNNLGAISLSSSGWSSTGIARGEMYRIVRISVTTLGASGGNATVDGAFISDVLNLRSFRTIEYDAFQYNINIEYIKNE